MRQQVLGIILVVIGVVFGIEAGMFFRGGLDYLVPGVLVFLASYFTFRLGLELLGDDQQ